MRKLITSGKVPCGLCVFGASNHRPLAGRSKNLEAIAERFFGWGTEDQPQRELYRPSLEEGPNLRNANSGEGPGDLSSIHRSGVRLGRLRGSAWLG